MMFRHSHSVSALSLLLSACVSGGIPEGEGQGILAVDAAPPPGVETFARPQWHTGDRIVFLRGGVARDTFMVEAGADGYRMVDEETGSVVLKDLNLADVGAEMIGDSEPRAVNVPGDARFHWPLWLGKSWTIHFVQKQAGQVIPLIASYRVEAEETVTVPAGTFRTLRILRTIRPATEEPVWPQQSLHWYAPEIGLEVRSLVRSLLFELDEYQKQR